MDESQVQYQPAVSEGAGGCDLVDGMVTNVKPREKSINDKFAVCQQLGF